MPSAAAPDPSPSPGASSPRLPSWSCCWMRCCRCASSRSSASAHSWACPALLLSERLLEHLVQLVRGPVEKVLESADGLDEGEVLRRAVRANVLESVDALVRSSELLRRKQAAGELRTMKEEYSSKNDDMEHVELELRSMHLEWAEWCVEYKEEADSQRTDTQCEAFAEMNQAQLEEAAQAYTQLGQQLSDQAKAAGVSEGPSKEDGRLLY